MKTKSIKVIFALLIGFTFISIFLSCQKQPTAIFTFTSSNNTVVLGYNITFTNISINGNKYLWDFGDGSTSTEENPNHIYSNVGTYLVTLTALSKNEKKRDKISASIYVIKNYYTDNRDGQTYNIVQIGNQIWMAENLNYYTNDSWYYYSDSNSYADLYGRLYTWNTACNVCPNGWHLPIESEWTTLNDYLGENAGGKMKETGTIHWWSPNTGATNETGFTALPGGGEDSESIGYYSMGRWAWFWSCSVDGSSVHKVGIHYDGSYLGTGYWTSSKSYGYSVRCIRD